MKKLIRSKATRAFLNSDGGWTGDVLSARQFREIAEVQRVKDQLRLQNVEIYYSFCEEGASQWDFTLPLSDYTSTR